MSTQKVVRGYRLIRPLGAGGMGSVYVAEKLATHQLFAVKFMQDHLVADASYVVRFEREIGALRAIRHPNVVDVFEACLPTAGSNDPPFLVMELLDGEGLDQLLKRKPILPVAMAVEITLQVLDGLAAAHAVGVIHRDLGPSNVFLEPQPGGKFRAKILDFGLARPISEEGAGNVTQEGTLMGKPAYVAPELFTRQGLDARSDLFAIGIMLYRMVAGRFPYRESASQMLWVERYTERDQVREYPPPRAFNPNIPESLDAVIVRATRRNPDERYPSARDMQQALLAVEADILDGQETVMIEPSPRPPGETGSSTLVGRSQVSMARPSSSRRWLPVVAASLVLACALVVALLLLFGRGGAKEPAAAPAPADAAVVVLPPSVDAGQTKRVHLVVLGAPSDAVVRVGEQALSGDPPEGDVPWADGEVEVVVAAQGFETYRTKVTPDQHKTIRVQMQPILVAAPDAGGGGADAGPAEAGPAPEDTARPVRPDVFRPRDYGRRPDAGAPPPPDAASPRDTAVPRDTIRVPVDGAGRLPEDPFASARRLPQEAPF
ncbi:MAG: serine/threonine protein kinase [Myxococcales bacterium]|nr:serine/threonine protein kinase [Myxococcales bacterium]